MEETTNFLSLCGITRVCHIRNRIRGSKDLRAEIGKFPNSTNERKQMSTKTMKQRIALVAVSALTAGLFSVVSTPAANAAADATIESLFLATSNSDTGLAVVTNAGGEVATDRSVGFLALTNTAATAQAPGAGVLAGVSATAAATSTAKLVFNVRSAKRAGVTVTGGTITSVGTETTGTASIIGPNSNVLVTSADTRAVGFVVTPNAGATTMTVSATQGAAVLSVATAGSGTAIGSWVISIQTTIATDVYSPSLSAVAVTTSATAAAITTSVDASTSGVLAGNPLFIQMINKNPYGSALAGGTYVATATNGATVAWGALGGTCSATAAGSLSVATLTPGDGTDQLRIDPSQSVTTSTTTVTITHNGSPVTTKTLTFYGEVKKIVIESVKSGLLGTSTAGGGSTATAYAVYSYRDSADGKVPGGAATFSALTATSTISTGVSVRSPSRSVQAAVGGTVITAALSTEIGVGTDGVFAFTCTTTPGATSVSISTINTISLATITAPVAIACYGPIATYTVSTDKASYAVGEVATITINAKDAVGNPVADSTVLTAASVSVGGGSLTKAIAGTELFAAGKVTVQAQMTTAGKFNTVVTLAGSTTTTATAGYAVTDGGVSNAEVLQSIVALIASINKQIRALQKLILKR